MMPSRAAVSLFALLFTMPALGESPAPDAQSERWTVDSPPSAEKAIPQGQVLKWCEIKGKRVRYATNIVSGYRLCGNLSASRTCDPSGKRFIAASADNAPYAFKDCSIGRRIYVKRHDDPIVLEPPPEDMLRPKIVKPTTTPEERAKDLLDFKDYSDRDPVMSPEEKAELRRKMKERDAKAQDDIAIDIDQVFRAVTDAMKGISGK